MILAFATHNRVLNSLPASQSNFNHVLMLTGPQWVRDATYRLLAACTYIIHPARVPLPSFHETYPLCDNSVPNFVAPTHEFMMEIYICTHPLGWFPILDPIIISLPQVVHQLNLTLVTSDVSYYNRATLLLHHYFRGLSDLGEPFGRLDAEHW